MLLDIFKGRVSQSDVQSDRIFSLQPHLYHVLGGAVDIEAEGAYYGGSDFGNDEQKKEISDEHADRHSREPDLRSCLLGRCSGGLVQYTGAY